MCLPGATWVWKNTSLRHPHSYVHNVEYEIFEWDLANTFNYAEMAAETDPIRPARIYGELRRVLAPDAITIQVTGNSDKLADFLRVLEPFGIRELVQSGMVAIGRGSRSISERPQRPVAVPAPLSAIAN